jgi:pSer/pThr/pTyr-binding forkhead associated (FHA) protein
MPAAPYAYLSEMGGSGTQYPLAKAAVCIGRSAGNDIRLANDSISSRHAEILRKRAGDVYVVDLGSSNGVYVNEVKVEQMPLNDGDVIELGEVRLRFAAAVS